MARAAAIYARVSTEEQAKEGTSLDSQIEAMLAWASDNGYRVPKEYVFREEWSGAVLERPQLDRVRELARQGNVQGVLVYSWDRLSRNTTHQHVLRHLLCEKNGVDLISVTEPEGEDMMSRAGRQVMAIVAEIERELIRERTMRGKRNRAKLGKLPTGGGGLYGYYYNKETGKREINEEEAQVVRMIFHWLVYERMSLGSICLRLIDMGIPAPKGGRRWSTGTVGRLVRRIDYTGRSFANTMKSVEPKTHVKPPSQRKQRKTARKRLPREQWIELAPDTTPPIISEELFEAAQEQLKRNRERAPRGGKYRWLLGGHVRCECGQAMYSCPARGYRYYRCRATKRIYAPDNPCNSRLVNADQLEPLVWNEVKKALLNPNLIVAELERQTKEDQHTALEREIENVKERLERLTREERRILKLYRYGEFDFELLDREMNDIAREKAAWDAERVRLEERLEAQRLLEVQREAIETYCRWASQNIEKFGFEEKRKAIEALQVEATVCKDGKVIIRGVIPSGRVEEEFGRRRQFHDRWPPR